jgi:hypothetical protein
VSDNPAGSVEGERPRKSFLSTLEFHRLEHACAIVAHGFHGKVPYLVGSSTDRSDYRDVDIRSILPDDEFDARFGSDIEFWGLFCLGVSAYLTQVSGLPIDYQVQRQSNANEKFKGKTRNPMGHGLRNFAGGGDFR